MKATVRKRGKSAAVREEAGRIVIEPVWQKTSELDDLLEGITRENLHEPVDLGSPEGSEVW
jgi:antitoxin MazE